MTELRFPAAVVFDLDGTLVDSAPDIARALNEGLSGLGLPDATVSDVHRLVGTGAGALVNKMTTEHGVVLSDEQRDRVMQRFFARYREVSAEGNGLFPGAKDLLGALKARGTRTAICTNKAEDVAHIAVRALGIADLVDITVGARDDRPRKPAPDMIMACLTPFGVTTSAAVMIGDSKTDRDAARAAGLPVILTSFGYTTTPVADLAPDAIVDHLNDVLAVLPRLIRQ
jgi:phosphoglycolate phosphatase